MNNLETRRNKINSCMAELFNLYMEDRKNIKGSISLDGVKCTLTFGETSKNEITDKKVMKLDDLKGVVINCKTKKESDRVLTLFDKLGVKWGSTSLCSESHLNIWNGYNGGTCYTLFGYDNKFGYSDITYFKGKNYVIKSAQWFLDNFTPKE